MKKIAGFIPLLLLAHCGPELAPTLPDRGLDIQAFHGVHAPEKRASITIPILRSPELERRWGKPQITVLADGTYRLEYSKPGNHWETLTIYGTPGRIDSDGPEAPPVRAIGISKNGKPQGVYIKQQWRTTTILGRPIHFHETDQGTGADPVMHSTVTFPIERPGQPVASYRLTATSNQQDAEVIISSYFSTATF